jgi:hypothetical protein
MQRECKSERPQGITLLHTSAAQDLPISQEKVLPACITRLQPRADGRKFLTTRLEHRRAIDAVEGVAEVYGKDPLHFLRDLFGIHERSHCVNNRVTSGWNADTDLKRREDIRGLLRHVGHHTFRDQPPDHFANRYRTIAAIFLLHGDERGPTDERKDLTRGLSRH